MPKNKNRKIVATVLVALALVLLVYLAWPNS